MGIIGESIAAYAQPLFDETDGSVEQMQRAMAIAQMCWNFALTPEDERDAAIDEMKPVLKMADGEFDEFKQKVILPMIERHCKMFPGMHSRTKHSPHTSSIFPGMPPSTMKPLVTGRNAPCPCGSARKYKHCCGR